MSGGVIGNCPNCSRLLIVGQRCMCAERPTSRCDCTHDSNSEHAGPTCRQRERDTWAAAMKTARKFTDGPKLTASTPEPLTGAEVSALRAVAEASRDERATWFTASWLRDITDDLIDQSDAALITAMHPGMILRLLAVAEDHARLLGVVAAVEALVGCWESEGAERGPDDQIYTAGTAAMLRAALDTTATEEGA